jgi:hypothetical protein
MQLNTILEYLIIIINYSFLIYYIKLLIFFSYYTITYLNKRFSGEFNMKENRKATVTLLILILMN